VMSPLTDGRVVVSELPAYGRSSFWRSVARARLVAFSPVSVAESSRTRSVLRLATDGLCANTTVLPGDVAFLNGTLVLSARCVPVFPIIDGLYRLQKQGRTDTYSQSAPSVRLRPRGSCVALFDLYSGYYNDAVVPQERIRDIRTGLVVALGVNYERALCPFYARKAGILIVPVEGVSDGPGWWLMIRATRQDVRMARVAWYAGGAIAVSDTGNIAIAGQAGGRQFVRILNPRGHKAYEWDVPRDREADVLAWLGGDHIAVLTSDRTGFRLSSPHGQQLEVLRVPVQ